MPTASPKKEGSATTKIAPPDYAQLRVRAAAVRAILREDQRAARESREARIKAKMIELKPVVEKAVAERASKKAADKAKTEATDAVAAMAAAKKKGGKTHA